MNTHRLAPAYVALILLLVVSSSALAGDCEVGNLNPPTSQTNDIFMGNETYAYHFFPPDQCTCPEDGMVLEAVHMLLYFDPNQVPVTFQVEGGLMAANFNPGSGCMEPGPVICNSAPVTYNITTPGMVQIDVLMPPCPAEPFNSEYFLFMKYAGGGPGWLVTDNLPQPCIEYVNFGPIWEDLFNFPDKTGGGKNVVWGDIICALASVPEESNSWGSIKSLYR